MLTSLLHSPPFPAMGRGRKHKRDTFAFFLFFISQRNIFQGIVSDLNSSNTPLLVLSLKYFDLLYLSRDLCSGSKSHFSRWLFKVLMGDSKFLEVTRAI